MASRISDSKIPPRQRIPKNLEGRLLFDADHTCCICHDKKHDVQIHHISGRHRSTFENLIVLCLNCHSRVEQGGGLGKGFAPEELRRYKAHWMREVKRHRKANLILDREFGTVVELEVRKLSYALESLEVEPVNESKVLEILGVIRCYTRDFGPRVKEQCLSVVYDSCKWLYHDAATERTVNYQTTVVFEALPIRAGGLRVARREKFTKTEKNLIAHGIDVAGEICYDVCKYVRKKNVAEPAVHLLADLLRFTCLNGLEKEKAEILDEFDGCMRISNTPYREERFQTGLDLLKEWKDWAMEC